MPVTPPAEPSPPRRARRWLRRVGIAFGGLALVLFVVALGAWILIVEVPASRLPATVAALEARGETLDIAVLAPPLILDGENAAILFAEAFHDMERADAEEEVTTGEDGEEHEHPHAEARRAWVRAKTSDELAVVAEYEAGLRGYIENRESAMELAEAALRRPGCRFDLPYEDTQSLSLDSFRHYGGPAQLDAGFRDPRGDGCRCG